MNPRIVKGRRGTAVYIAARGRVGDLVFQIGVSEEARRFDRIGVEDRLLAEAGAMIALDGIADFDWPGHRFARNAEFDVWERTLTSGELRQLRDD